MYLIDETYFIKNLAVPNSSPSLDVPNSGDTLEFYIDQYARQLLQNALGNVLFDELDSNIENGVLKLTAEQKWKDLVYGKSYSNSGGSYKWKGLLVNEGSFKSSILAQYTYYHWHLDKLSRMSGVGEVVGNAVNAQSVNGTNRSVKVWNDYIEMYQGYSNKENYSFSYVRGVPFHDYYGGGNNKDYVCLLDYLRHHKTEYPNALMKREVEGFENSMGL